MSSHHKALSAVVLVCLLAVSAVPAFSQATTTGTVTGTVVDPAKAVVPDATVTLSNKYTGARHTTTTNSAGIYLFASVLPGEYSLRCSAKGFKTTEVGLVVVEVTKTSTYDLTLEVGSSTTTVEVRIAPGAELQTQDASIGTVLSGDSVLYLPTQQRSVTALILLQPGVSPNLASSAGTYGDTGGGQVNGANVDQTTFYVDGGDATSDLEGTDNYVSPQGEPQPAPFIAVPAEWTQEFRTVTASSTASFARSSGGEVSVLTKSGTNTYHGAAYEYYYGDATSANFWINDRLGLAKPHQVNNRFGGNGGGYLIKDKLFFYGGYEQRDLFLATSETQLVPTMTAREGIITINNVQYNLATTTACGGMLCDPRGIGISPVIAADLATLPVGNNAAVGDGENTIGYTASFPQPVLEKLAVARLDYTLGPHWNMFGTFHFNKYNLTTTNQFNITCPTSTPNCTTGADTFLSTTPAQPRFLTAQINGVIGSNFTTQTHASYLHDWWNWNRAPLVPEVPGTAAVIDLGGEAQIAGTASSSKVFGDPINYDTQDARARIWGGKDWFLAEDASWLHGKHTIQFGGGFYLWNLYHERTDDVIGGLTTGPQFYVGETVNNGGSFTNIPSSEIPTAITSGSEEDIWGNMYATLLGIVDRSSQIGVRNGQFQASPLGTLLYDQVRTYTFDTYVQDAWKITSNLTFTYGVNYGVSFAPHEATGKQVVEVYASSNVPVENVFGYFKQRNEALSNGIFYGTGPTVATDTYFGFSPIDAIPSLHGSSVRTQFNEFGPRLAFAWNVPYKNWFFGNKQTVVRLGYSLQWNRTSAVGEVLTPLLGDGLASVQFCSPIMTGACNTGATITGANGFRIGVDGNGSTILPPQPTTVVPPLVPCSPLCAKSGTEDPNIHTPYSHVVTLDVQRAFAHNWLIDIGAIGRFQKDLWQNQDLNATDIYAKTPACTAGAVGCTVTTSGQTLWQAYDAMVTSMRSCLATAGNTRAICAPLVPLQPFFENAPFGAPGDTDKMALRSSSTSQSVSTFMEGSGNYDYIAPSPLDDLQFGNGGSDNITTDHGIGNYGAGFITVRKAFERGLDLTFNYTWSHALGTGAQDFVGQQYTAYASPTPFNIYSGYGSNLGDRRNVVNMTFYYKLPFGKGRQYFTGNNILDRAIGGWYVSGIYTFETGLPSCVGASGNYGSPDGYICATGSTQFGDTGSYHATGGLATGGPNMGAKVATTGNFNIFANPVAVYSSYTYPLPGVDNRPDAETFNLPNAWNVDFAVGKNILATERYTLLFDSEFFNVFNHPNFSAGSLSLTSPANFGVISSASTPARVIQFGLRFAF